MEIATRRRVEVAALSLKAILNSDICRAVKVVLILVSPMAFLRAVIHKMDHRKQRRNINKLEQRVWGWLYVDLKRLIGINRDRNSFLI